MTEEKLKSVAEINPDCYIPRDKFLEKLAELPPEHQYYVDYTKVHLIWPDEKLGHAIALRCDRRKMSKGPHVLATTCIELVNCERCLGDGEAS